MNEAPNLELSLSRPESRFRSASQQARVTTERWTLDHFYCTSCGQALSAYPPGTPVYDFYSPQCHENFQLKSAQHAFARTALGANYDSTMEVLLRDEFPSLVLLHYNRPRWIVEDLSVVHRACITTSCIIPRKPLGPSAKRRGWRGYTISLDLIPELGRINVIRNGSVSPKSRVLAQWTRTESLLKIKPNFRGWTADVLRCVERLFTTFTLENVYAFEAELASKHPDNHNIRAKIRQQLQVLRDLGIIEFASPGVYRYLRT